MSVACFLHLFVEPATPRESALSLDPDSVVENSKPSQHMTQTDLGTETFTEARTEERDQDHHLSQLYAIPRPA
jgi:hypothetical protein